MKSKVEEESNIKVDQLEKAIERLIEDFNENSRNVEVFSGSIERSWNGKFIKCYLSRRHKLF